MNDNQSDFHHGVKITLPTPDAFLMVKETLTRMGIPSKKCNTLYQSCCIFHKRGEYYIMHFKEMFVLDGKENTLTDDDYRRRNTIAKLLDQWGMCTVVNRDELEFTLPISELKIVPHKEKSKWTLVSKYAVGKKKQ